METISNVVDLSSDVLLKITIIIIHADQYNIIFLTDMCVFYNKKYINMLFLICHYITWQQLVKIHLLCENIESKVWFLS